MYLLPPTTFTIIVALPDAEMSFTGQSHHIVAMLAVNYIYTRCISNILILDITITKKEITTMHYSTSKSARIPVPEIKCDMRDFVVYKAPFRI